LIIRPSKFAPEKDRSMPKPATIWCIHMGRHFGTEPVDQGFVAIGWPEIGDPRGFANSREPFKAALRKAYSNESEGKIPVWAGQLYRFVHEMRAGDVILYPSKQDRMVNIGRFTEAVTFEPAASPDYPNRRGVNWLAAIPRDTFRQSALNEIGSALTIFQVKTHVEDFLAHLPGGATIMPARSGDEEIDADDTMAVTSSVRQAKLSTDDFIIRRLDGLTGYEFEDFVAHLLVCMGYNARVTEKSGDGGVDVIAHTDPLGLQPPIIKVQCKKTTSSNGEPEVMQLRGTLGEGEFGLFVNLGAYSHAARLLERNSPKIRLINGTQLVALVKEHYDKFTPKYRSLIPLMQTLVPDLPDEEG
jgi:restriction system protein